MQETIHRFWGGSPMPQKYVDYGNQWAELNPSWTVIDWTEPDALMLLEDDLGAVIEDLYRRDDGKLGIELYVQMADIVGYVLVRDFGGAYFNCDMQPVRPLSFLPPESIDRAWASKENTVDDRIVNAAFGAPDRDDPFWVGLLKDLPARYFANPSAEMVQTTGPAFLTDHALRNPGQLNVFPNTTFNPIHWDDIPDGGDAQGRTYPDNTIAVHHWGHKLDHRSNNVETGTQR